MNRSKQKRKATKDTAAEVAKKRKAARVSRGPAAPPPIDLNTTHAKLNNYLAPTISQILSSNSTDQVASALNALLCASADDSANYCLGMGGEKVINALVKLFDEAIGWDEGEADDDEEEDCSYGDEQQNSGNLEPTGGTWDGSSLSGKHERWRNFCRARLASPLRSSTDPSLLISETDTKILDIIIAIFRNLSYVAQNLRFLYHNERVLRVLTGAMYYRGYAAGGGSGSTGDDKSNEEASSSASSSHNSNMCIHAIQTLVNMAPLIDITGRQLFIDRVFLESDAKEVLLTVPDQQPSTNDDSGEGTNDTPDITSNEKKGRPKYGTSSYLGFGGMYLSKQYDTKAEALDNIPNSVVWGLVGSHVRAVLAIFPALSAILDPNDITTMSTSMSGWHRPSAQATLELLTSLVDNPYNKGVFLCISDAILHRLTDMLFMPRLGPESMDYIDPVSNTVTRVLALKLTMGYDATVDSDMRDRACDLLVKLTDLSTGIKRRLGMAPSISGMARRQYESTSTTSSSELAPSLLRSDETSSSRRMNVRLYDSLLSMVGSVSGKGDSGSLAVRLLSNLALVPENKAGVLYVERKLISKSATDPSIAQLACSGILKTNNK